MLFNKNLMLVLVGLVGLAVNASPIADEVLEVISTQETDDGTLTVYGEPTTSKTKRDALDASLEKRQCGSSNVECSGDHTANTISCEALINSLSANSGTVLPNSPRSICLTQSGGQCCVSWARPVNGLRQGSLVGSARTVLGGCRTGSGRVSGLQRNVNLQGTCTTQCLSDRATGCS